METLAWLQYYWQAILKALEFPNNILGIIGIVILLLKLVPPKFENLWRESKMNKYYLWIKKHSLIIFGILVLITLIYAPYGMYQQNQKQMSMTFTKQQTQIDDLQKQLSSITSLTFTQLPITNEHINAPDTAETTVRATPAWNPAYSGTIPCVINNIDPYNHVKEFVKITVSPASAEFDFTYIDPATLPPDVSIVNKYSGTDEVIIMINDISPGGNMTIDLPIYSNNTAPSIRGTAKLSIEVLYKTVLP